jgi:phage terminase large subunit
MTQVTIPYKPRTLQAEMHNSLKRWNVLVMHRRFGKTVWAVNHLIRFALTCELPRPRVAFIAPTFTQAKRIAWDYVKFYAGVIPGVSFNETELRLDFPNGARLTLLSAENPDALRGIYLDLAVFDEFGMQNPRVWGEVVRPALSDREGAAVFLGTPAGHNHFFDLLETAKQQTEEGSEQWYWKVVKASESGLVKDTELQAAQDQMTPEQYEQEYECSFTAAIIGAYYAKLLTNADDDGRITQVPYDPAYPVHTAWDLGINDSTAIWFAQIFRGGAIHVIDYYENGGVGLQHYADVLNKKDYNYGDHLAPHDIEVRELGSGKSRIETAFSLGIRFKVIPRMKVADGINASRMLIPKCYFDRDKCHEGLEMLRQYRQEYDERKKTFRDHPRHDFTSHSADAFRYLASGLENRTNYTKPPQQVAVSDYNPFSM